MKSIGSARRLTIALHETVKAGGPVLQAAAAIVEALSGGAKLVESAFVDR